MNTNALLRSGADRAPTLRLLQLLPDSPFAAGYPCDGIRVDRSRLGIGGTAGVEH